MAFDIQYLGRVSSTDNQQALKVWTYNGTATGSNEAVAVIAGAGYFNTAQQNLTAGFTTGLFAVGDVIHIHGNDANGMYVVTSITTNVAVGAYASAGAIDTANLADGAVTSAKLDEQLIRHTQVDLTLAEFIGSNTAPHQLIAAPGANKRTMIHRAGLSIDYGGNVLANGGTVQLTYGNAAGVAAAICTSNQSAATLIAATADTVLGFTGLTTTLVDASSVNAIVSLSTETADFTGGVGSTYKIDVWYSIVDLA